MRLALLIMLLVTPIFATKLKCPSLDESDTAAYVRLLTHVAAKRSGTDALGAVADSATPINPMAHFEMREAEALGFRRAFDELLGGGNVDWQVVRREAARLVREKEGSAAQRGEAVDETRAIVNPKLIVPDLFKVAKLDLGGVGFRLLGMVDGDGILHILPQTREWGGDRSVLRHANGITTAVKLPGEAKESQLVRAPNGDVFAVGLADEKITVVNLRDGKVEESTPSKKLEKFLSENTCELSRNSCGIRMLHSGSDVIITYATKGITQVERIGTGAPWPKVPRGEFEIYPAADGRLLAYGYTPKGKSFFVRDLATGKDLVRRRIERADERRLQTWMSEDTAGNLTVATIAGYPSVMKEIAISSGTMRCIPLGERFYIGSGGYVRDARGTPRLVLEKKGDTNAGFQHAVFDAGATAPRMIPGAQTRYDELLSFSTPDGRTFLVGHADGMSGTETYIVDIDSGGLEKFTPRGVSEQQITDVLKLPDGRVIALAAGGRQKRLRAPMVIQLYGP